MKFFRDAVDSWYDAHRNDLFERTKEDPELAHEGFVKLAKGIHRFKLERLLLNCPENALYPGFEISNAAGFNKNGDIPPQFLRYLGFDRIIIGTVTGDKFDGAPRPRIKRYVDTGSLVNWMKLPGFGAIRVAEILHSYGDSGIPYTINLMATPGKQGDELLRDLEKTVRATNGLRHVDRYELNISCPNTHSSSGAIDAREEYAALLESMLVVVNQNLDFRQELDVKLSPDMALDDVKPTLDICKKHKVARFTIGNTTREHDSRYITSPPNESGIGGASGEAVYMKAKTVQDAVYDLIKGRLIYPTNRLGYEGFLRPERVFDYEGMGINACGGISSAEKARERTYGKDRVVKSIQLFTPLIFRGPRLIRELRAA